MKRRGVQLWEILVILAVIAIVAALLFPVFAKAKVGTHKISCLSNLKQIGTATLIYTMDYDDRFPNRDRWMDAIRDYSKNELIVHCPTLTKEQPNLYGYAFYAKLSEAKAPSKPETVPLAFDSLNMARNASGDLSGMPLPGRHNGGNYVAYADAHAKSIISK